MSTSTGKAAEAQTLRLVHGHIKEFLAPNLRIYWFDLLASYAAFLLVALAAAYATPQRVVFWPLVLLSALALYRTAVFIHEIVHFRNRRGFPQFRRAWNVLVGIPFLIPLFMYECHAEHHNWRSYGTAQDAEYKPLARMSRWNIVGIVVAIPMLPLYGVLRFGILAPLAWLSPGMRQRVWKRSSALKLDVDYEGGAPSPGKQTRLWTLQEIAVFVLLVVVGVAAVSGAVPWQWLLQYYLTYLVVAALNTFRLLGAHRYIGDESGMTVLQQVGDTWNYTRRPWLAVMWAPVGLRLHALHHLAPGLPYHNYQRAHERLMTMLPSDSVYIDTQARSLPWALGALWRVSGQYREYGDLPAAELRLLHSELPHGR